MRRLVVIDVVGLTPAHIGPHTPALRELAAAGFQASLGAVLPAVTCSAQTTMLTGTLPREHGIVGNGWYFRDQAEVWLWRQSNRLTGGAKVWERARERHPGFTCAKLFWWYCMYSSADWSVTPRPTYWADGRKGPDVYTDPPDLHDRLDAELGEFPLFHFWGPGSDIRSSAWIGRCAESVLRTERPDLTLVYLPHLDYDLQRHGADFPGLPQSLREVDAVAGGVIAAAREHDTEVIVLSEYGITNVTSSVSINRALREAGFLRVHRARNGELLDPGASRAFALADHQIAHVYVRDEADVDAVRRLVEGLDGVDVVLGRDGKADVGLDHPRSGELVAVAAADRWFDYYYWLDESAAPDFARTVDIHRKPGYDPVELFLDPQKPLVKARIAGKLLGKKLGLRTLMNVIPLDSSLVRGSHGRLPERPEEGPVLISSSRAQQAERFEMCDVADLMLATMFD